MKIATVMNDEVQEIQKVLEGYLENRKAAKIAVEISVAMQGETQHTHNGEVFFVHKDEYILFMGWLINSLIREGWSEKKAWFAVCTDSRELGHYCNSVKVKRDFEVTDSRMIAGKCDLAKYKN